MMTPTDQARCATLIEQLDRARYPATWSVGWPTCRAVLNLLLDDYRERNPTDAIIPLWHGPHGGLMFKGVELLLTLDGAAGGEGETGEGR